MGASLGDEATETRRSTLVAAGSSLSSKLSQGILW